METDEISRYLAALEREDCYRVDATLKESPHEVTQRVFFVGANDAEQGPFVRKFIDRESGMGAAYERIFEAQQAGRRFKHLPALHECYRHEDLLVVVMEFVNGETLADLVYRRDPSMQLAAEVFPALCDAVAELHESFDPPLIHRDLKPSNVMLANGELTVIDFGIAREFREGADADTTQFGTRAFAPPEQFGFGQTTVRSDVYALGMLLYYCLTEKIPTTQIRDAQFEANNVPPHLRPILTHATNLNPARRYASATELKAAFLGALAEADQETARLAPKRRRAPMIIAVTCIAAIIVATTTILVAANAPNQPESQSAETNQTPGADETTASAITSDMQTKAPQRNGFNPATNISTAIAGVNFQIPSYFGARIAQGNAGETYYYAESGTSLGMIMTSERPLGTQEGELDDTESLNRFKDGVLAGFIQSDTTMFAEITAWTDFELAGLPARIVTLKGTANEAGLTTKFVYFINRDAGVSGAICLSQSDDAQFDYSADFAEAIASATPAQ